MKRFFTFKNKNTIKKTVCIEVRGVMWQERNILGIGRVICAILSVNKYVIVA
jgi:hypothetical protein